MQTCEDIIGEIQVLQHKINSCRPLSPSLENAITSKLKLEWTYNSNALEGNTLSLGETAFFLREGLTSEGKPLQDFLEAKNHAEAIEALEIFITEKKELSEFFIKSLHSILMQGISSTPAKSSDGKNIQKKLHAGEYKKEANHVLTLSGKIHKYCDPLQVKNEMENLLTWLQTETKISGIEKAILFHYKFVKIHPFDDGNGRMSRLLMNLLLMKEGFPPCIIQNTQRRKYIESLEIADTTGNTEIFCIFVTSQLLETLQMIETETAQEKESFG